MQNLLPYLAFLACPVAMGLMMWMMMRMGGGPRSAQQPPAMSAAQKAEFAQLRAELEQLRAENDGTDVRRPAS